MDTVAFLDTSKDAYNELIDNPDYDDRFTAVIGYVRDYGPIRITDRDALIALANIMGLGSYWHDPSDYDIGAIVNGTMLGTAGFWPMSPGKEHLTEMYVSLTWKDETVAYVNIADLFSWATQ